MRRTLAVAVAAAGSLIALSGTAQAAGVTYVSAGDLGTPKVGTTDVCSTTTSGWCTYQRGSGTVGLVDGAEGTPAGQHLQLSTPSADNDKAFALEYNNRGSLSAITDLSYEYLVTATGSNPNWAPAMNVEITTADGVSAVLVYEPLYVDGYTNPTSWSSQTPTTATGGWWATGGLEPTLQAAQAHPDKWGGATWANVQTAFAGATVKGIGVNQGGSNTGLTSQVDSLTVNGTTYDFGEAPKPKTADDCKNGGWAAYTNPAFPNQGQCIQFVNTGKVGTAHAPSSASASVPSASAAATSTAPAPAVATGKMRAA